MDIRYGICKYKQMTWLTVLSFKYRKVANVELLLSETWCDREKLEEILANPLLKNKMKL